jgi:hypothetical protein
LRGERLEMLAYMLALGGGGLIALACVAFVVFAVYCIWLLFFKRPT